MRAPVLSVAAVTAVMLVAVACARRDDAHERAGEARVTAASVGAPASCDTIASLGTCAEYQAKTTFGLERSMCDGFKGRFNAGACPSDGRIARCEMPGGEVKRYYAHLSFVDAKADCEGELVRGRFVAENQAGAGNN